MSEEKKEGGAVVSVDVTLGKEMDAAFADVVRALLLKTAGEFGDLTANLFGMAGDWINRKRQINAALGIQEVRRKLENNNIDMKDVTPPKEEEVHLMLTGLSLSDDETVRDMWAGLFAKALDPNSGVEAERPFISALQALSPKDAKIIDFLAFIIKTSWELEARGPHISADDIKDQSEENILRMSKMKDELRKNRIEAVNLIKQRGRQYGIEKLIDSNWSLNLKRLGIIENISPVPDRGGGLRISRFDERNIQLVVDNFDRRLKEMQQIGQQKEMVPLAVVSMITDHEIVLTVRLTNFGLNLSRACGLL